jgi:hypothetical protein
LQQSVFLPILDFWLQWAYRRTPARHDTAQYLFIISALIKSALFIPIAPAVPYWYSSGINSSRQFAVILENPDK